MYFFIPPYNVIQRSRTKEILLFESEFFSFICWVIRVKYTGYIFCLVSLFNSPVIITFVEFIEIKSICWLRSPKPQIVCIVCIKSWNGSVISNCYYFYSIIPVCSFCISVLKFFYVSIESHLISNILSFNFPRISMVQPKIRNLNLVTILN